MSEEPKTHHVLIPASANLAIEMGLAVVTVKRPEELAPALAQREKSVVIENDEIKRDLARYEFLKSSTRWLIISLLASWMWNQILVHKYSLDTLWHLQWVIGWTFDGKLTVTPTDRPQQTQPPPEFPD